MSIFSAHKTSSLSAEIPYLWLKMVMAETISLTRNGIDREERGSEAEHMQSQYLSESQKKSTASAEMPSLELKMLMKKRFFLHKKFIDREDQKQKRCSRNISLNCKNLFCF